MYEAKLDPVRDAGKFVYHLKTLKKAGLVSIEKGTKKYGITELGKILVDFSRDLEEYIAVKRGRMFVRTSRMTIEEFDRTRIAKSLVSEAGMPQTLADELAAEAEDRLLKFGITYLSAPLIRELVNTILIERKLEEYRHKLTRLGLPVNDVTMLLRDAGQKQLDATWIQRSAGERVTEEYVLLNSLPRETVDAHLSGQLHLDDAASWILKPSIFFHDARPFLRKGVPGSTSPSSLENALDSLLRVIRTGERQVSTEQVLDHFNILLAPFIAGLPRQRVQEAIRAFLQALNWDGFSNTIPPRVTIGLDRHTPSHFATKETVGPNGKTSGVYSDFSRETEELFRTILDASLQLGRQQPIVNPSINIRTLKEAIDSEDELLNLAFQNFQFAIPNFAIQSGNQFYSTSSDGSILEESDDSPIGGGAIVGTVQLNLPRASYEASGKEERFIQSVKSSTIEAVKALDLRRQSIIERMAEGILPLLTWQADGAPYFDSRRTQGEIGLLGLAEAVKHHTKADLWEKSNTAIARKVVEAAKQAVTEADSPNLRVRVGLHSSPQASSRIASIDAERFGFSTVVYQGSKKLPYYNDAPTIPLTQKVSLATRASIEGEFQRIFDGGSLLPILTDPRVDARQFQKTSSQLAESGVQQFTFSSVISRCRRCYATSIGVRARCENCGFDQLTVLAKLGGRLLPLDAWPDAQRRNFDHLVPYEL
jgi:ribonucleoside-triphosphate reductase (formate)